VEFALPPTGTVVEMPSAKQPPPAVQPQPVPAPPPSKPSKKSHRERKQAMHEPVNEDRKAAASGLQPADLNGEANNLLLHQFEDMTSTAAKAAKDYRSWMLEHMRINMCAALDYANGLASVSSRTTSRADAPARGAHNDSQDADKATPAAAKVADEYRAKAFELMSANINTTLEYAQRLVNVKTPTEFVELSMSHSRKQLELIMKQTAELGSIAQRLATPGIEAMTSGFAKALRERKE
jgi:hypothetical protein